MVEYGVAFGDNLDSIERTLKKSTARVDEFRRLTATYGLVSRGSESTRVCSSFPAVACRLLHDRRAEFRHLPVSVEKMTAISPGYPPAMMTFAFAFLVQDEHCALLKKARMLHEYEVLGPKVNARFTYDEADHRDKIVAVVAKRKEAAAAVSHVPYDEHIAFLKSVGLIVVVGGGTDVKEYAVAEPVSRAARAWDQKDVNKLAKRFSYFTVDKEAAAEETAPQTDY